MAVTLNAAFASMDPQVFRALTAITEDPQAENLIENLNWLFANLRMNAVLWDFRNRSLGDGIWQGVGGMTGTADDLNTYVTRQRGLYYARASATDNNQLYLVTYAQASGGTGNARANFFNNAAPPVSIDNIVTTHTVASGLSLQVAQAAGGALDGNTLYRVDLDLLANVAAGSWLKCKAAAIFETRYTTGASLP